MNENQQFLLYTVPNGAVKVEVFFKDETAWLTQKALAELFGVKVPAVNKHLKNIFESGELVEASVISVLETTAADGKNYQTRYYKILKSDVTVAKNYLSEAHVKELNRLVFAYLDLAENRAERGIVTEKKAACRLYTRHNADFTNEALWLEQFEWLRQRLETMHKVFAPIVKNLKMAAVV